MDVPASTDVTPSSLVIVRDVFASTVIVAVASLLSESISSSSLVTVDVLSINPKASDVIKTTISKEAEPPEGMVAILHSTTPPPLRKHPSGELTKLSSGALSGSSITTLEAEFGPKLETLRV